MATINKLSVIIPVFNEENTIDEVVRKVLALDLPYQKELIIVDDGSTDASARKIDKLRAAFPTQIKVLTHNRNRGKGAAVRTGLAELTGDVVIIQDADLELDPKEFSNLILPIAQEKTSVVYGSRFLAGKNEAVSSVTLLSNRLITGLANLLFGTKLTDEATAYKVFASSAIKPIKLSCDGFEFCSEVTAKLLKNGQRIIEVPIGFKPRDKKAGKKLRLIDGVTAAWVLLKYRFGW